MAFAAAIDFEAETWPVLLCEPSPGLYAIRISHETLVKIWPSTESETDAPATSHVDLNAIRKAGFIDVQTYKWAWDAARAILTYWAAFGVSRDKWDDIDRRDIRRCLLSIGGVLYESRKRLGYTRAVFTEALPLREAER